MTKTPVVSPKAPKPAGPYSPAVCWNDLVFVSGQGPIDPRTGHAVGGGIAEQTLQALKNVTDLLQASGSTKDRILKVQVYLADIDDFQAMNAVYSEFFEGTTYPARTTVGVAGLPGGIGVEIDAIASLGG